MNPSVSAGYRLRPATETDIEDILALRRLMFEEMGRGDAEKLDAVIAAGRAYLRAALPAGQEMRLRL